MDLVLLPLLTMLAAGVAFGENPQELDLTVRVDLQRGTVGSLSCPLKTKPVTWAELEGGQKAVNWDGRLIFANVTGSQNQLYRCQSGETFASVNVTVRDGPVRGAVHDTVGHCQHGKPCAIPCPSDKDEGASLWPGLVRRASCGRESDDDKSRRDDRRPPENPSLAGAGSADGDPVRGLRWGLFDGEVFWLTSPCREEGACKNDFVGEEAGRLFERDNVNTTLVENALGDPLSKTLVLDPVVESDLKGAFFCKLESTRRNDVVACFEARRMGPRARRITAIGRASLEQRLEGRGDSDRLVCLEDGLWSFPEAYCKIECPEVPNIPNAKLLTAECLASGHDVGSICRYKCNPGFYVKGNLHKKTQRKYFKLECLEGGQWVETSCEPISCPALPDVFQGMYTCTNGLYFDTVCTLQCQNTTENTEISCTKNGKWTAEFSMCPRLQGSCSAPPDANSVEYSCDQGTDIGAVCYPTCIVALDMDLRDPVILPSGTTADSLKHWMVPTKVQVRCLRCGSKIA
ncbi:hypothetical protein Q5P01_000787 [Channa striata]|uniref:Sushi domain-containing protein n=1 Tax=Channa striata TaxID=64152 RepID=A0AA88LIS6_CHASR|nr:hypothetical protein Q5P01_000787 [Channa striata]